MDELAYALDSNRVYPVNSEIWVTKGSYIDSNSLPSEGMRINHSQMKILGGFKADGTSTDISQRDLSLGATKIGAFFGLYGVAGLHDFSLDGFTFLKGFSTPQNADRINFKNIKVNGLYLDAGGIVGTGSNTSVLENCEFTNLSSREGSVFTFGGQSEIRNCKFINNTSEYAFTASLGSSSYTTVRDSRFENNRYSSNLILNTFYISPTTAKLDIANCEINGGLKTIIMESDVPVGNLLFGKNIEF
jgi:hypothetical protein